MAACATGVLVISVAAIATMGPPPPREKAAVPAAEPAPEPLIDELPRVEPGPARARGLLPPPYEVALDEADAAEMRAMVAEWLAHPRAWTAAPRIEHARGVVFVESSEDRGDDPPYPRSAAPESMRVCGTEAAWLRAALHHELRSQAEPGGDGLDCHGNVCSYGGHEYAPSGYVVFRKRGVEWVLDAWVQVYTAALAEDIVDVNTRYVTSALRRLASTTCRGEPAGFM